MGRRLRGTTRVTIRSYVIVTEFRILPAMSSDQPTEAPQPGEIAIQASQLRPGVHVRLPVPWLEHQFVFSSFVIADEEQARMIAAMNLPQIFCDPKRCRVPLSPAAATAPSPEDHPADEQQAAMEALEQARLTARNERIEVVTTLQNRLLRTEQVYRGTAKTVTSSLHGFASNPTESVRGMIQVCEHSTAALCADPDSAFALIASKGQEDGQAAHALSVMTITLLLGKQAGLPEQALHALGTGAPLHDVGKRWISPSILRNKTRNRHEDAIYQSHCRSGYDAARTVNSVSKAVLDAILCHHERLDGSGFPDGLSGRNVPLTARVVAIADRFDNLVNPIDQRDAIAPAEALSLMWMKERDRFDASLLPLFIKAMGVYPPGSIVQLSDGRIGAVVMSAPKGKPLLPKVLIYTPDVPRREAPIADLATQEIVTIKRTLRLQDRSEDELDYLLPRRKIKWSCVAD